MKYATFGPGGNSKSFYDEGFKSTLQAPGWIERRGLDAYEYQAGNGISASPTTLAQIGAKAKEHEILMSLHTPY
ncbi:MAG: endonuclease IV, partial [Clostridia bacterium]|nr:endonuclease IV [Clostridia bacterium]